jgi:membrane associated rhomboid family serine protease
MIFFYIFGNTIEKELNYKWVVVPFFIGGVSSFLLSIPFFELSTLMIGASAAIFSLTAIVMLLKPLKFSFYFLMPLGLVAIIYFAFNLIAINTGTQGNISYIGHVIGFLIGLPFGVASNKNWHKNLLIAAILFGIYFLLTWLLLPIILAIL